MRFFLGKRKHIAPLSHTRAVKRNDKNNNLGDTFSRKVFPTPPPHPESFNLNRVKRSLMKVFDQAFFKKLAGFGAVPQGFKDFLP